MGSRVEGEGWEEGARREGRRGTGSEDKVRSWILLQGLWGDAKGGKNQDICFSAPSEQRDIFRQSL